MPLWHYIIQGCDFSLNSSLACWHSSHPFAHVLRWSKLPCSELCCGETHSSTENWGWPLTSSSRGAEPHHQPFEWTRKWFLPNMNVEFAANQLKSWLQLVRDSEPKNWLSHDQILDLQRLWAHKDCFKCQVWGIICHTAVNNSYI